MPTISDATIERLNDEIAQAVTAKRAFTIVYGLTRTMLARLLDLNGEDTSVTGLGVGARHRLAYLHGWHAADEHDDVPADGRGPCDLGRFEAHSRRPWQCRGCKRRRIDHRQG